MAKYAVSMKVELRVQLKVEADSFEEAFGKASEDIQGVDFNECEIDWAEDEPVNATRLEDGVMTEYDIHPYPDKE
jgi:hypothetical protein